MASQTQTTAVPLPGEMLDNGGEETQDAEANLAENRAEQERVAERQRKKIKTAVKEGAKQRKDEIPDEPATQMLEQGAPASSSADADTETPAGTLRWLTQNQAVGELAAEFLDMNDEGLLNRSDGEYERVIKQQIEKRVEAIVKHNEAIFRGRRQLEQVRSELGDRYGVADDKGEKRLKDVVMHWPTACSNGCWALSVENSVVAWSEQSFVTRIFLNEEHGLFKGPAGTNMAADDWNGLLMALEGWMAENSLLPVVLGKAPITVRTPLQGRGLKGADRGAR